VYENGGGENENFLNTKKWLATEARGIHPNGPGGGGGGGGLAHINWKKKSVSI